MTNKTNKTGEPASPARRPTPAEYRAAKFRVQRETTLVVKRTLLAFALLAGLYYCFLVATQRAPEPPRPAESPAASDVETPVPESPSAPNERPSE